MIVVEGVFNFTENYYTLFLCVWLCLKLCAARLKLQNCIFCPPDDDFETSGLYKVMLDVGQLFWSCLEQ